MKRSFSCNSKHKGSALLIIVAVAAIIMSMIAISLAKVSQSSQNTLISSKIALQAQQYAAAKAEIINSIKYDELAAQARDPIPNTNYSDEVIIGSEEPYPDNPDIMQKICRINVYAAADVLPRYSIQVIRTSVPQGSSLPTGSIIPWYGNLADIPDGFALCNGSNGTPDLRDKFITGAGSTYALGDTGGENEVKLEAEQNVSHYHSFGRHTGNNSGYFLSSASTFKLFPLATGTYPGKWNGSGGGGYWSWDGGSTFSTGQNLITSLSVGVDASKPHENRPPYFALYYIMKLE